MVFDLALLLSFFKVIRLVQMEEFLARPAWRVFILRFLVLWMAFAPFFDEILIPGLRLALNRCVAVVRFNVRRFGGLLGARGGQAKVPSQGAKNEPQDGDAHGAFKIFHVRSNTIIGQNTPHLKRFSHQSRVTPSRPRQTRLNFEAALLAPNGGIRDRVKQQAPRFGSLTVVKTFQRMRGRRSTPWQPDEESEPARCTPAHIPVKPAPQRDSA